MNKKYQIIYADPPWRYNDKMKMKGVHGDIRGAESFYPTMPLRDICNLGFKIDNFTADNCILFLWVTCPLIAEGLEVMKTWGFKYKTIGFTWVKTTKQGKIHLGMGHYTRGNSEICLIGVKGKFKVINHSISQIIMSEIDNHSKKPEIVRNKIVELCGDIPRIELFARPSPQLKIDGSNAFDGWDIFGDEVDSDIELKV